MTLTIPIVPGQALDRSLTLTDGHECSKRQAKASLIPPAEWTRFGDAYDAIVVTPYRRVKISLAVAFILQLVMLMATQTMTRDESKYLPTTTLFLLGPGLFAIMAAIAAVYMFTIYDRVSQQLQNLCDETHSRLSSPHRIAVRYRHPDTHHDVKDHSIQFSLIMPDIETAIPVFGSGSGEWNPLLQLRSLWKK